MKKFTQILIILGILIGFGTTAMAQSGTTEITKTEEGDKVIYSFNLTPNSGVSAADYVFSYNQMNLKYEGRKYGPLSNEMNSILAIHHIEEEKVVRASFATLNDVSAGGTICNLIFTKTAEESVGKPSIGVDVEGQYNADGEPTTENVVVGDPSAVQVKTGENINNPDVQGTALSPSNETIPEENKGMVEVEGDAEAEADDEPEGGIMLIDEENPQIETNQSEQSHNLKNMGMLWGGLGVAFVIGIVFVIVWKKKKA